MKSFIIFLFAVVLNAGFSIEIKDQNGSLIQKIEQNSHVSLPNELKEPKSQTTPANTKNQGKSDESPLYSYAIIAFCAFVALFVILRLFGAKRDNWRKETKQKMDFID